MKKLSMAVVALCLVAGLAQAGRAGFNSKTILEATPAGRLIQAEGAAAVGATKQFESFGIKVAAKVEDGTRFMVMVMTPASQIPQMVGSLEMVLGVGSLRIVQEVGGPALPPVQTITSVLVSDIGGDVILQGKFGKGGARQ